MRRAAYAMLVPVLLAGFSCPDESVTRLVVVPMGAHHYAEADANFIPTIEREVFVLGDSASPLILGRVRSANVTLSPPSLRFASSAPAVATVSDAGVITARGIGEARILVTYESLSDTLRVVVVPRAAELRLVLDPPTIRVGGNSTLRVTAYDSSGTPFPRTYYGLSMTPSGIADAHIDPRTVTGIAVGTGSVIAWLMGQDFRASTTITVTP